MNLAARVATVILTGLALYLLLDGSMRTLRLLFATGEGAGFGYLAQWPLTWVVFGLLTLGALYTAGRLRDGFPVLAVLLGADLLLWFVGVPLLGVVINTQLWPVLVILAFDAGAVYVAWRFLVQGSPNSILGH